MEALKLKGIAKHGYQTVAVPRQFDEQELEVIVLSDTNKSSTSIQNAKTEHQQKVARLLNVVGTARNPDAPLEKYDVYDQ